MYTRNYIKDCHGKRGIQQEEFEFNVRKTLPKCYIWSIGFYGAKNWTLGKVDEGYVKTLKRGAGDTKIRREFLSPSSDCNRKSCRKCRIQKQIDKLWEILSAVTNVHYICNFVSLHGVIICHED
jgi:hypothetical protein